MATDTPQPIYREDYRPPAFRIEETDLQFELHPTQTRVTSRLKMRREPGVAAQAAPLELDGEQLQLQWVELDGVRLSADQYSVNERSLTVADVPDTFELRCEVLISPESNTALSGLYISRGVYCTQCEAEGFRRITYYLDRPDVMAKFTTTITAPEDGPNVMLSNGNPVRRETLEDGRRRICWQDPHPKPSYLFALVAGDLSCKSDTFTTKSGREVKLEIWVEERDLPACDHALASLGRAMRWDEQAFGLEYDLDIYMIVAVSDFNMGAMENKGLNVFNTKYVLARPETATDDDYEGIEAVIAHEYFHNWTGNRVTCRDWFQLTLKEGLTVYRDACFTADMTSVAVKRIHDVKTLRTVQFAEDAGPMSHPIRPESYIEMNNFYTTTVYEKGAEVVRMYEVLLGKSGFRRGMDLYFERHDGQAVTCDDFRAAMADANGVELEQFEHWYSDRGTPVLEVGSEWNESTKTLVLNLRQKGPGLVEEGQYRPRHIPVVVGLIGPDGEDQPLILAGEEPREGQTNGAKSRTLELTGNEQSFHFVGLEGRPIPSVLRGFSAPVRVKHDLSPADRAFCLAHDSDSFSRWDAGQSLAKEVVFSSIERPSEESTGAAQAILIDVWGRALQDSKLDDSMKALMLALPDERELAQEMQTIDVEGLDQVCRGLRRDIAERWRDSLAEAYANAAPTGAYSTEHREIHRRRLRNQILWMLSSLEEPEYWSLASQQYENADNMTESQGALHCLALAPEKYRAPAFSDFLERFKDQALVVDKWFAMQATSPTAETVARVDALRQHPEFQRRNPNRFRSLIGSFAMRNMLAFHRADGAGYRLVADEVIAVDALNPQVAARTVAAFNHWRRFDAERGQAMQVQLRRILGAPALSRDTYEIVSKSLGDSA